jgi:hypothetical protein
MSLFNVNQPSQLSLVIAGALVGASVYVATVSGGAFQSYEHVGSPPTASAAMLVKQPSELVLFATQSHFEDALARVRSELDNNDLITAQSATRDAVSLYTQLSSAVSPNFFVNDIGFAAIEWRIGQRGLLLIFGGDGKVTLAKTSENSGYAESMEEHELVASTYKLIDGIIRNIHGADC